MPFYLWLSYEPLSLGLSGGAVFARGWVSGSWKSVGLSHVTRVVLEFAEAAPDEASLCP